MSARPITSAMVCAFALSATFALSASAADIPIDDPDWMKTKPEDRARIESELKAAGAIGPDDKIVYKGPVKISAGQKNTGGGWTGAILDAGKELVFRKQICKAKANAETDACSRRPATERAACRTTERARFAKAKSSC